VLVGSSVAALLLLLIPLVPAFNLIIELLLVLGESLLTALEVTLELSVEGLFLESSGKPGSGEE